MIPLKIEKIISETADTKSFLLTTNGEEIPYLPGQFLTFVFTKNNGSEDRRSYSISSSPVLHEPLQITVKRISNGAYSRPLVDKASEGDILYTTGASGFFVLPENISIYQQLVFFAAGSGITPVIALIKTVLHVHASIAVTLVYSNNSVSSTIFYHQLRALQKRYPERLMIQFLFSSDTDHTKKRLNVVMITAIAEKYRGNALFYLCGPSEYMRTIAIVLRTEGVNENAIRREIFHTEKPVLKAMPPDALPHTVTAIIDSKEHSFISQYPVTILQAAKNLHIPVPYSCEAGQCGTCSATCLSGKVWMWHNEVLLDEEIEKGRVLTCTGYAMGGDVVLKF